MVLASVSGSAQSGPVVSSGRTKPFKFRPSPSGRLRRPLSRTMTGRPCPRWARRHSSCRQRLVVCDEDQAAAIARSMGFAFRGRTASATAAEARGDFAALGAWQRRRLARRRRRRYRRLARRRDSCAAVGGKKRRLAELEREIAGLKAKLNAKGNHLTSQAEESCAAFFVERVEVVLLQVEHLGDGLPQLLGVLQAREEYLPGLGA